VLLLASHTLEAVNLVVFVGVVARRKLVLPARYPVIKRQESERVVMWIESSAHSIVLVFLQHLHACDLDVVGHRESRIDTCTGSAFSFQQVKTFWTVQIVACHSLLACSAHHFE
jgi:hypothetical protein